MSADVKRSADELAGQRIARKVLREMLASMEHIREIDDIADQHVANYSQALYAHKHIRIYCRLLASALRKLP